MATQQATVIPKFDQKDIDENMLMAALSYVGVLVLIPLLLKRNSRFSQEHARQGLVLFIAWIIGSFVFWIPFVGWFLAAALLIVNLNALFRCMQGEFWEIPYIGAYRHKINL